MTDKAASMVGTSAANELGLIFSTETAARKPQLEGLSAVRRRIPIENKSYSLIPGQLHDKTLLPMHNWPLYYPLKSRRNVKQEMVSNVTTRNIWRVAKFCWGHGREYSTWEI